MTNKSPPFFIEIVEVMAVKVWTNPKCHGCIHEWLEVCKQFEVHTRSDDFHCLFCINNPNSILPIQCHYKTVDEVGVNARETV